MPERATRALVSKPQLRPGRPIHDRALPTRRLDLRSARRLLRVGRPPRGIHGCGIERAPGGGKTTRITSWTAQKPGERDRDQRTRQRPDEIYPEMPEVADHQIWSKRTRGIH